MLILQAQIAANPLLAIVFLRFVDTTQSNSQTKTSAVTRFAYRIFSTCSTVKLKVVLIQIANADKELLKYADTFLRGDLTFFYETRSAQNKSREPYKIHTPDKEGNYKTTD